MSMSGNGVINGRGPSWWNISDNPPLDGSPHCTMPKTLEFVGVTNLQLSGLVHRNSLRAHIRLEDTTNATLSNLRIYVPGDSSKTDGIVLSQSKHVSVLNSIIRTGDECIAIKAGTSFVNITSIACGPGQGISIGCLGFVDKETVEDVYIANSINNEATNGAIIMMWSNGAGYVRRVTFEDIYVIISSNPIIINQHYCDSKRVNCTHIQDKGESGLTISSVTFMRIIRTAVRIPAIKLDCSAKVGCRDMLVEDGSIFPKSPSGETSVVCSNEGI